VHDGGYSEVTASLPALISVTEKINEPRYPNFKGIMAAKKKPVSTLGIDDLGLDPSTTGLANAASQVVDGTPRPPRAAGEKTADDGTGGTKIAEFLAAARLI
jgi:electron transfer flavoprotein beta subunit